MGKPGAANPNQRCPPKREVGQVQIGPNSQEIIFTDLRSFNLKSTHLSALALAFDPERADVRRVPLVVRRRPRQSHQRLVFLRNGEEEEN